MPKFDLYETVTNRIVEALEKGTVPWRNPILTSHAGKPRNLPSDRMYRGINTFLLMLTAMEHGYGTGYWLTYKQAIELGGHIKKGEKSSIVIFWKQYDTQDKKTGKDIKVPVLRYYRVFNVDQCEGVEYPEQQVVEEREFTPIESAESIVKGFPQPPTLEHDAYPRACYKPLDDKVHMPNPEFFESDEAYYATLLHELAHATGHSSRLDRKIDTNPQPFGSPDYSKEELVAEMASAYACSAAELPPVMLDQSAAYINSWVKVLKGDKKLVVSAAGAAQKAADWMLNQRQR